MNGMNSLVTRKVGNNMKKIFIVKSFGPESGYVNLKAFADQNEAAAYAKAIDKQIPRKITDEFVEVEELEFSL